MDALGEGLTSEVARQFPVVRETLERVRREALFLRRRGARYQRTHAVVTFLTIVLGVAAPALVTYAQALGQGSSTSNDHWLSQAWGVIAILVTGLVGAGASLRSAFRWGDRFGSATLSSLELDELASTAALTFERMSRTVREDSIASEIQRVNSETLGQMHAVLRRYFESERAVAAQAAPKSESRG
jgi:uncharacterized protein DUF4231